MTIKQFKQMLDQSNYIVFFGGAGVSTESNIPDFRSASGLYTTSENKSYPPEYMLSHTCFIRETKAFYEYYKKHMLVPEALPNKAHLALAELEAMGKLKAVITQNIDGLHQKAGSKAIYELHGSVHRNFCISCHAPYNLEIMLEGQGIPYCKECGGLIKPDVVLYEEGLDMDTLSQAIDHIKKADLLIVGGTSLKVYPAAGLLDYFTGSDIVIINQSQTTYDSRASLTFTQPIGQVLHEVMNL